MAEDGTVHQIRRVTVVKLYGPGFLMSLISVYDDASSPEDHAK